MRLFDDLTLTAKSALPLLLMAALFGAVTAFGIIRFEAVTSEYGVLSTETVPGALRLIRMNQSVLVMPYSIYRLAGLNCPGADAPVCKQTRDEFKAAVAFAVSNIDEAKVLDSSRASEYEKFKARFLHLVAEATPALDRVIAGDTAGALAAIAPVAEQMVPLRNDVRVFSASTLDATDSRAGKLASTSRRLVVLMIAAGAAAIGVSLVASWWISVIKVARPLTQLQRTMGLLAEGSLATEVQQTNRCDEVGAMARAVAKFKENGLRGRAAEADAAALRSQAEAARAEELRRQQSDVASQRITIEALGRGLDALANCNLVHQIAVDFPVQTQPLKDNFNRTAAILRQTLDTVTTGIQGMRSGAGQISDATDDLSRRTEQQAASLEETAAALDEITATVKRTAESSGQALTIVLATQAEADRSGTVVRDTVSAMNQIEKSSQEIGEIIGVIDEIAFQTNLLALNAGVEAARAGETGRGFAVVASEVRVLAQRSATAAKEIKALVTASGRQVSEGVRLVGDTGEVLSRIATQVGAISSAIGDIAKSAQEQATGLQQVNAAVNQMDQVTQQNAAMVEQTTAASHSLMQETDALIGLTKQFTLQRHSRPALQMAG